MDINQLWNNLIGPISISEIKISSQPNKTIIWILDLRQCLMQVLKVL